VCESAYAVHVPLRVDHRVRNPRLAGLGRSIGHGLHFAPGGAGGDRAATDAVFCGRLPDAVERLNSAIPAEAGDTGTRKVLRFAKWSLVPASSDFQAMIGDGVGGGVPDHRRDPGSRADQGRRPFPGIHPISELPPVLGLIRV